MTDLMLKQGRGWGKGGGWVGDPPEVEGGESMEGGVVTDLMLKQGRGWGEGGGWGGDPPEVEVGERLIADHEAALLDHPLLYTRHFSISTS